MKRMERGVSLIELMLVTVIISLLITVALPIYQGYLARAQQATQVLIDVGHRQPIHEALERSGD